jgi:hypothetical protein
MIDSDVERRKLREIRKGAHGLFHSRDDLGSAPAPVRRRRHRMPTAPRVAVEHHPRMVGASAFEQWIGGRQRGCLRKQQRKNDRRVN